MSASMVAVVVSVGAEEEEAQHLEAQAQEGFPSP